MIEKRTVFEIHRLYAEGLSARSIARRLRLSRKTVKKYLENPAPVLGKRTKRPSKLDRYHELIEAFLDKDPEVKGPVILQRLKDQGFEGKISILRDYLCTKRKHLKKPEAFMRFESAAGDQMQIDWGHFGSLPYGQTSRKLYALAVIESHSRMLYVAFTHSQKQAALHQGLVNAFRFFGGAPRKSWSSIIWSAPLRSGTARLSALSEAFLDFLRPFSIVPRACNPGAAHEKGKIENSIRYLRQNFWPLRTFTDLDDVQRQAMAWLNEVANVRIVNSPTVIYREGVSPYRDVVFNIQGRNARAVISDVKAAIQSYDFPLEYHAVKLEDYATQQATQQRLLIRYVPAPRTTCSETPSPPSRHPGKAVTTPGK